MISFFGRVLFVIAFMLAGMLHADSKIVRDSTKHSDWKTKKHWIEIHTQDNQTFRYYLDLLDLDQFEYLTPGETVIVENEQVLDRPGQSSYDLIIIRINRSLRVEGPSSPLKNHGKEVHRIYNVSVDELEESVTFQVENGEKYKLFVQNCEDLNDFQNGQELDFFQVKASYGTLERLGLNSPQPEIAAYSPGRISLDDYREKLNENVPFLVMGIKNFETEKEYHINAEAFSVWKRIVKQDRIYYKVVYYNVNSDEENSYLAKTPSGWDRIWDKFPYEMYLDRGERVMILEHIVTVDGTPYFKWIHLDTGKIFLERGWENFLPFPQWP